MYTTKDYKSVNYLIFKRVKYEFSPAERDYVRPYFEMDYLELKLTSFFFGGGGIVAQISKSKMQFLTCVGK